MIRKLATYLLLFVITFSVGFLQFGYHLCNEDGLHLFDHDCITNHQNNRNSNNKNINTVSNCCANLEKVKANQQNSIQSTHCDVLYSEDCCIKEFFFFVNPLPEKIQKCNVPMPQISPKFVDIFDPNSTNYCIQKQREISYGIDKIPINIHTSIENCSILRTWII